METIFLEYAWILLVLILLEGLLSADNAIVMAVMVRHLPKHEQKKALFYGLVGAFVFRFAVLFLIATLVKFWQIQAAGAIFLLFMAARSLWEVKQDEGKTTEELLDEPRKKSGFWMTVLKVELADIAFALDSMLAAVALAVTLTPIGDTMIGGMNAGQFWVVFAGGLIGLVVIRFAARYFIILLEKLPKLEIAAYLIVGWVGVKLAVLTLAHPGLAIIPESFPSSTVWTATFWVVLLGLVAWGYIASKREQKKGSMAA